MAEGGGQGAHLLRQTLAAVQPVAEDLGYVGLEYDQLELFVIAKIRQDLSQLVDQRHVQGVGGGVIDADLCPVFHTRYL